MKAEKFFIRKAFARAAPHYDAVAGFQREAGRRLIDVCASAAAPHRVLDAGCGTGYGLQAITQLWPACQTIAVDFAAPMLRQLHRKFAPVCADIERLPFAATSIDLVWSNLAMQWCDLNQVAHEFARVLRDGGHVAATTLGPGTFAELRRAFAGADGFHHTNDFVDERTLHAALANAGLMQATLRRESITCHYPDLRALLASVRELGANRVVSTRRRRGLMGKSTWRRFADNYARMATPQGLPLTYDTYFLLAVKR